MLDCNSILSIFNTPLSTVSITEKKRGKIAISYTFDNEEITGVLFYNLGERNERATLSLPMVIPGIQQVVQFTWNVDENLRRVPIPTASIVRRGRRWKFGKRMPRGNYTCVKSFPRIGHSIVSYQRIECQFGCQTLWQRRRNDYSFSRFRVNRFIFDRELIVEEDWSIF